MFQTLAYYATVFHRSFTAYTTQRLQQLGLSFGSLFPVIYVGKHPGCTQAELTGQPWDWTGAIPSAVSPNWWRRDSSPGKSPDGPII